MELDRRLLLAALVGALSILGCGEKSQGAGGGPGSAGMGGFGGRAGVSGMNGLGGAAGAGGTGGSSDTGGTGGDPYQVCTLGLCMEDADLGASCQEVYDACLGRGHYPRSCRMDADKTCGVFGQTGPY